MIRRLLDRYGVSYVADGTHKHNTAGWVNVHCPFCRGTPNYHLGISENGKGAHCWRCGPHSVTESLSKLLGISKHQVRKLLDESPGARTRNRTIKRDPQVEVRAFKYPKPYFKLMETGKEYLRQRKFDPDKLEYEWGLLQTGPVSFLDKISYANRIIIPIYWDDKVVSFQGRDITGRSKAKYLACTKGRERIHHKHIVYGKPKFTEAKIIVEGPADVWRLGKYAVATMGIKFTMEQILNVNQLADRFIVLFDAQRQAQEQARKLASKLKALGKRVDIVELTEGDPGDLAQNDADHLVKELIGGRKA